MLISGLDWDDKNVNYIAKHKVTPEEVEDVCFGDHFSKIDPDSKIQNKVRYILTGKTESGKYLDVVIEKLHGSYCRPITAFEMSENYKRSFKRKAKRRGLR